MGGLLSRSWDGAGATEVEKDRLRGCVGKVGACARNGVANNVRGVVCRGADRPGRPRSASGEETGRHIQPGGESSEALSA